MAEPAGRDGGKLPGVAGSRRAQLRVGAQADRDGVATSVDEQVGRAERVGAPFSAKRGQPGGHAGLPVMLEPGDGAGRPVAGVPTFGRMDAGGRIRLHRLQRCTARRSPTYVARVVQPRRDDPRRWLRLVLVGRAGAAGATAKLTKREVVMAASRHPGRDNWTMILLWKG